MPQRPAQSRVEALLALAIAILLAGLVLTVLARVREDANRQTCRNKLRQLGMSMLNYNDTFDRLPPLTDGSSNAAFRSGLPSVFAQLVPFIESTPYRTEANQSPDRYHGHSSVALTYANKDGVPFIGHGGMVNFAWKVFLDPSDTTAENLRDIPMTLPDGSTGYYATGSYAVNGQLPWGTGSFPRSFPKGPENAILIGERPQVCVNSLGETIYNFWGVGFYSPHMPAFAALTPAEQPDLWSTEQIAPALPLPDESSSDRDAQVRVRIGRQDAAPQVPDFQKPVQRVHGNRPCDPRLPGSMHFAGMQVAMADGSVRIFTYDTDPWIFWAACVP
jgi:hypothetical protein